MLDGEGIMHVVEPVTTRAGFPPVHSHRGAVYGSGGRSFLVRGTSIIMEVQTRVADPLSRLLTAVHETITPLLRRSSGLRILTVLNGSGLGAIHKATTLRYGKPEGMENTP
jgi:hypothetical protein